MDVPVIALIGAGASYASGNYATSERPPLTRELFTSQHAQQLLRTYTLAQAAGSAIQRDMAADSTVQFEAALRRLREDGFAHHAQMAIAVPPFLQALLLGYSERLRADAFRYGVLVDEMLKIPAPTHFVSLNYDTLLDNQLAAYSKLDTMDDYVAHDRAWSLIKPHGSIAWFVEQPAPFDPKTPPVDLLIRQQPISCVPVRELGMTALRNSAAVDAHGPTLRYPAIALPDGPKDELVLPTQHRQFFLTRLHMAQEIQLLVLGYSGLDQEVLKLITQNRCTVRRLTVVNSDGEAALEVYGRILAAGIEPIWSDVYDGSFEGWIDGGMVRQWVQEYSGPFASVTEPEMLRERIARRQQHARASRQEGEPSIRDRPF